MSGVTSNVQDSRIVRRYAIALALGFVIMAIGATAQALKLAPPTTILQPNPADPDAYVSVNTPFPRGFTEILGLAIGATVNLYSIQKYASNSYSIKEEGYGKRKRLIIAGLFATILVIVLDAYRMSVM